MKQVHRVGLFFFAWEIKPGLPLSVYSFVTRHKTNKSPRMKLANLISAKALAAVVLLIGTLSSQAQNQARVNHHQRLDRFENKVDRRENVRDRKENRFDRREDVRDRKEDRFDRREDVRDRREDVRDAQHQGGRRDRLEDVRDRKEDVRDRREDVRDRKEDVRDRREDVRDRKENRLDRRENKWDRRH